MDVPAILAIIGGVALLVGLFGGGVEAKEVKVPKIPRWSRFLSGLIGAALIGMAIWLSYPVAPPEITTKLELPTDTPVVKPTDTPTPKLTNAPTPTAAINADPTVYDNFNNSAFDGNFNQDLWFYQNLEFSQLAQRDGALIVTRNRNSANNIGLNARKYHFFSLSTLTSGSGMFFEAKLKLSSEERNGNVNMQLYSDLPGGPWWTQCTISNDGKQEQVACNTHPQNYVAVGKWDDYGTWHTFRIEAESSRMHFNYYLDGQMIGSVPIDTESLRNASFTLGIGVHGTNVTGYIDDVRIGQTGQ